MQRICWILSFATCALLASAATATEPLMPVSNCPCQTKCLTSPAYALVPGCCEARRHCFDNAWDGYCEQRARWDTFWCKVGTGALCPCTPCRTHDGRGAALEVQLRPAAAACNCQKK